MHLQCLQLVCFYSLIVFKNVNSVKPKDFRETRIIGGKDEEIEKAPWQVSLQRRGQHICGGCIYSEDIIITAAHCVAKKSTEPFEILAGSSHCNKGGIRIKVLDIVHHESYNKLRNTNDIAILRLAERLTYGSGIKPIPLAKHQPKHDEMATLTGWGTSRALVPRPTPKLQTTQLRIMSPSRCRRSFGYMIEVKDIICAKSRRSNACLGDSGGPLVLHGELVGIVSFGKFNCRGPSAFSNIANYRQWTLDAIKRISKE